MNPQALFFRFALFLLLTAAPAAQADHAAALAAAQQQLASKAYAALRATLAPLLLEAEPHLEALFLSGMAALQQADYPSAIAHFRAMLARDPSLVRPRLELALALQKAGERQAARYHYEQALAGGLPPPVVRNIYRQLGDIRERQPSLRMSLELASDSNPRQTTDSQVVMIGGLPYRLNNAGQAKTVYGVAASADLHWPLASDPTWFGRFYGEAYEYPGRELDSLYAQASLGKRFEWGQHHMALEAGGLLSLYQDRPQYTGGLLRASTFYRVSPRLGASASVQARSFDYARLPYLNGTQTQLNATGIYAVTPAQRVELGAGWAHYDAAEMPYSYTQPSASLRYQTELPGGWIAGARLQAQTTRYQAPDPFFGKTRRDTETRMEIDLLNRKLKWWSFTPRALAGYVERDSNLELYRYDRLYGRIGLTREF